MPSGGGRESPGRRVKSYWKKGKGKVIYFLNAVPFSPPKQSILRGIARERNQEG
jgi:hypothetical protein